MTDDIPDAIWFHGRREPSFYVGTPLEMVTSMSEEMGDDLTVRETVEYLLDGLAKNRDIIIGLPANASSKDLARLFVIALIDTGLAHPMAAA